MTLFRGYGDDLPLMEWLEQRHLAGRGEAQRRRRLLGHAARLRRDDPDRHRAASGTCTGSPGAVARAVDRRRRPRDDRPAAARRRRPGAGSTRCSAAAADGLDELAGELGPLTAPSLTPHADLHRLARARSPGSPSESERLGHPGPDPLLETEEEVDDCLAAHGLRPVELLDRVGLLGAADAPRARRLARRARARADRRPGATVVTNPVSNMKLAVGRIFDLAAARAARAPGRARHRRRRLEQLARPARRRQAPRARAEARAGDAAAGAGRRRRWRSRRGERAPLLGATPARGRCARRLPARPDRPPELGARRARRRPRLRGLGRRSSTRRSSPVGC